MVSRMLDGQKYDVFISYSRRDYVDEHKNVIPDNVVSRIKNALTTAGISYWFDEEGINHGDKFAKLIVRNIKMSRVFVFVSTENSNNSEWTGREIASAHMMKKHIIPVRIDDSTYNEDVMFYISILDYIDYKANPEKGIKSLVQAIEHQLEQIKAEENRQKEEENRKKEIERKKAETLKQQKEQEEKRRREEQQQLVATIEMTYTSLNNVESRLELDRAELISRTGLVEDVKVRDELIVKISNGGPIHLKYQQECNELGAKNDELRHLVDSYERKIENQQTEMQSASAWYTKRRLTILCSVLLIVGLVIGNVGGYYMSDYLQNDIVEKMSYKSSELGWKLNVAQDTISELRKRLNEAKEVNSGIQKSILGRQDMSNALSKYTPLIVYDIEVKNENERWGDSIYSHKSTYLYPRIKYFGIKKGTYKLYVKLYRPNGNLSSNPTQSPEGYSFMREVSILEGENFSNEMAGWGGKVPGHWVAGEYRIEFWYDNRILASKSFKVY